MKTKMENVDFHIVKQGIDLNIARAMYFHDLALDKTDTRSIHLQEKIEKTAITFYDAAYTIMMNHGVLYDEYIEQPDWITLRKLKRRY